MRFLALCGFAALAAATMGLSACNREAAAAVAGPKASTVEAACRADLLSKTPNPKLAQIEDLRPVPWREFSGGLKKAVFQRMAGENLGRMSNVAEQALTGGESATAETWVAKLKATNRNGKADTVPAWCRSFKSRPDECTCESPLRTE